MRLVEAMLMFAVNRSCLEITAKYKAAWEELLLPKHRRAALGLWGCWPLPLQAAVEAAAAATARDKLPVLTQAPLLYHPAISWIRYTIPDRHSTAQCYTEKRNLLLPARGGVTGLRLKSQCVPFRENKLCFASD